jgi:hypothetical protein
MSMNDEFSLRKQLIITSGLADAYQCILYNLIFNNRYYEKIM